MSYGLGLGDKLTDARGHLENSFVEQIELTAGSTAALNFGGLDFLSSLRTVAAAKPADPQSNEVLRGVAVPACLSTAHGMVLHDRAGELRRFQAGHSPP